MENMQEWGDQRSQVLLCLVDMKEKSICSSKFVFLLCKQSFASKLDFGSQMEDNS
jgi:hypothetical protein